MIECYDKECRFHGIHEGEEGPFCSRPFCKDDDSLEALEYRLRMRGYRIADLEEDNPYTGFQL